MMENKMITERIAALRDAMLKNGIDYYMIPTADFHNSEYVDEYFKVREHFSGFSGSNGTLVVSRENAGLWTDGRYFIQAEKELEGTGIVLFRMAEEGVPTIREYLAQEMKEGEVLGFDGRVVPASFGKKIEEELAAKKVVLKIDKDVADEVWKERPSLPNHPVTVLSDELCGKSYEQKLSDVREVMKKQKTDHFFLSKLDDLMWLFNIRGNDVECNPVALSYAFITKDKVHYFIQQEEVTEVFEEYAKKNYIAIHDYEDVASFLEREDFSGTVLLDEQNVSYLFYRLLAAKCSCKHAQNPTEKMKAVKNPAELENMRRVYLQDSAVLTRYIYWLKKNIGKISLNEYSAAMKLDEMRSELPGFIELSFPTIGGYKENAAMMHYEATEENNKELAAEGMYLVDSGGQYEGGTTDVTRTVVLGPISEEIKLHFTKVAVGVMQLTHANWLYGCTGRNLDILARQPLWDLNIDYKCGTGHGIGYILNVHEGPQNIRWKFNEDMTECVLEPGMVLSNEPGVYIAGSHGIRTENIMVAKNSVKNSDGQFMCFETLTYVPIDREALDKKYMSELDVKRIDEYHKMVFEKISPFLNEEEAKWLEEVTKPL